MGGSDHEFDISRPPRALEKFLPDQCPRAEIGEQPPVLKTGREKAEVFEQLLQYVKA